MLTYTGHIRDGKYYLDRSDAMRTEAITAIGEGGSFVMTIEPLPPGPTNPMHRYYRGVVLRGIIDALNDAGNAVDNTNENRLIVHEQMKAALLPPTTYYDPATMHVQVSVPSTATLSLDRFGRYITDMIGLCRDLLSYEIQPPPVYWKTLEEE